MSISAVTPFPLSPGRPDASSSPEQAARDFEAMLIAQLLKIAREAGQLDPSDDAATGSETYLELAEKHLAEVMAAQGGLGFAKLLTGALGGERRPPDPPIVKQSP